MKRRSLKESGSVSATYEEALLYKSVFGMFYRNYEAFGSDQDLKILSKIFKKSKILSDLQKCILYFNLPSDMILKEKHIPALLFPPKDSELKIPNTY